MNNTPNAERYLLESANLRRRQLQAAMLHGSGRSWRQRSRVWPAVVAGLAVAAVVVAVIGVLGAFHRQEQLNQEPTRQPSPATSAR
jgi:negative regulator of sigma E activity